MINDTNLRYVICTVCDGSGEVLDTEEAVDDDLEDEIEEDDDSPVADRSWEAAQGSRDDSLFDDVDEEDELGDGLDVDNLDEEDEEGN